MARTSKQQRVYDDLLNRHGRAIADAFFKAVAELKSAVQLQRVTAAIEAGNVDAALDALSLDPAVYNDLLEKVRAAHMESGNTAAAAMSKRGLDGVVMTIRFDGRNLGAERLLAEQSAKLITRLGAEQIDLARKVLTEGMARGDNPRRVALDLVGRVSRATGKREGGVLGLSAPQERYVALAREELASSDPAMLRKYLERSRRDRRFDRTVEKAIREGKAIPKDTADRMATAYERRLLQLRGEMIGRTEAMTSIQQARYEAYRQAVESGKVNEADVRKVWRSAGDKRVRHSHTVLDGESVGLHEPFMSPTGAVMLYPMDASFGAGPEEIIGCRCDCEYRIDFLANLR
jgi:hypothetical protein